MAVVDLATFRQFDAVLDSIGLILESDSDQAYDLQLPDAVVERTDVGEELSENKLDTLYWGANRSWHEGAGQKRLDMPEVSSPYRFDESRGIDINERGEARLLPATARILGLSNTDPAPQKMVATDTHAFVAAGQPNLRRFSDLDTADDQIAVSTLTETSQETLDLASDGIQVFIALGPDGTHRSTTPAQVTEEAFDATTGWSGTSLTFLADTATRKQGTASLVIDSDSAAETIAERTFGTARNFTTSDTFRIWLRPLSAISNLRLRLFTSAGNYFERTVADLAAGAWYEDVSVRLVDWVAVGAPDWANITRLQVVIPSGGTVVAPSLRAMGTQVESEGTVAVPKPVGTLAGDVMIAAVVHGPGASPSGETLTITSPEGWTLIRADGSNPRHSLFYKVAAVGEPSTYTFTINASKVVSGIISSWLGADNSFPINAHGGLVAGGSSTTVDAPSVSTTVGDTRILYFAAVKRRDVTFTWSAGTVETFDEQTAGDEPSFAGSEKALAAMGASGIATATASLLVTERVGQTIALTPAGRRNVHVDDFRSVPGIAFTHWSDWDSRVVTWAKDRLWAAGIKTGSTWRFFEAGAGVTSAERASLPEGFVITDIAELGPFIYFSAYRSTRSMIYAYDGVNAPFVALDLPPGEQALMLQPFSGAGLLIGVRRLKPVASGGLGVIYRAFSSASGHLVREEVHEIGDRSDSLDYAPSGSFGLLDHIYYGWPYADSSSCGLGQYDPETGGFSRHLHASVPGRIVDAVTFKGRRLFTVDGDGVWAERPTFASSGHIVSSAIDINISAPKDWLRQSSAFRLPSGASVRHEYSTDDGETWVGVETATSGERLDTPRDVSAVSIQYRVTLLPPPGAADSPVLLESGIGGWPVARARPSHVLLIRSYPNTKTREGSQNSDSAGGWKLLAELEKRWKEGGALDYQPPWFMHSIKTLKVRVADVRLRGPWGLTGDEQGGLIQLTLKEVA